MTREGRKHTLSTHDPCKRKLRHANIFSFGDLLDAIFFFRVILGMEKKWNLRFDNFFRSCILTVAFDRSDEGKDNVSEKSKSRIEIHTHHSVGGESRYHFRKDA